MHEPFGAALFRWDGPNRAHGCLLAVPARVRGEKSDGDVVTVELHPRAG